MSSQAIEFDPVNASPFVRVIASLLGYALKDHRLRVNAARAKGTLILRSPRGNPSATLCFTPTAIALKNGETGSADIVVTADFEHPENRPTLDGVLAHPIFGYLVLPLLNVKLPNWQDSATRFWQLTKGQPAMPSELTITCPEQNQSLTLRRDNHSANAMPVNEDEVAEIFAGQTTLERLFLGHAILVPEAIAGSVKFHGTVKHMAGLSQSGQKLLLGELGGD